MSHTETKSAYSISTDKNKMQANVIHDYLANQSYWSKGIPLERVMKSIEGSMCFGVFENEKQIGFARVITDGATMAYLADVFILKPYRGLGLSKLLMEYIITHPELQGLRKWMLATNDAHGLYEKFGFSKLANPEKLMELTLIKAYL